MTSRDTIDSCLISYDMAIEVSHTVDDNTTDHGRTNKKEEKKKKENRKQTKWDIELLRY